MMQVLTEVAEQYWPHGQSVPWMYVPLIIRSLAR